MSTLTPQFSGNRMVREYVEQSYLPAMKAYRDRRDGRRASGRDLHAWELELRRGWDHIHFGGREVQRLDDGYEVSIQVYLGELDPDLVVVELYAEPVAARETNRVRMERATALTGATHGYLYRARLSGERPEQDYTVRVLPWHADANLPIELPLVLWQR
jgi:starch phosphorylase